jgi:predicted ribosome quality control (RQC) complex YloA/Tae2 family protein
MKEFIVNDIKILVGNNAKENWELLEKCNENNLFLHLTSFPSCYVIILCDILPELQIIEEAAKICKNNTKYKNLKNISVDYTLCKNIKKGEVLGEVIFKSNKKVKRIII